jgi:hypothetical protein
MHTYLKAAAAAAALAAAAAAAHHQQQQEVASKAPQSTTILIHTHCFCPQPKTVLVPPMFERDLKARSRMVKSSYDYLFAKPSLR